MEKRHAYNIQDKVFYTLYMEMVADVYHTVIVQFILMAMYSIFTENFIVIIKKSLSIYKLRRRGQDKSTPTQKNKSILFFHWGHHQGSIGPN